MTPTENVLYQIDIDYFAAKSYIMMVFFFLKLWQRWFSLSKRLNKIRVQKVWPSKNVYTLANQLIEYNASKT